MSLYYSEPGIEIHLGDCRDILPGLGKFDLLLTDPPYGMGYSSERLQPGRNSAGGVTRVEKGRVVGDDAPFDPAPLLGFPGVILWGSNHYAQRLPLGTTLVWIKRNDAAFGSFLSDAEIAWMKGGHGVYCRRDLSDQGGARVAGKECLQRMHPTQKPVALMRWCLGFFPDARTVIDPYMGSGPVARACKDAGLRYVGIELVEKYCETAVNRLRQEVLFA